MNISTGGPQILLFERDQQLATLLISELQLAGYACQTARTAVEVFDAMARLPIKLVLVDLAQAAAARREFWVALDTQRRGRGIQVFTFHCVNIAGYGPRDMEEYAANMTADMEVDGMPGIINLVAAIQSRLPGVGATTMPRMASVRPSSSRPPQAPPQPTPAASFSANPQPLMERTVRPAPPMGINNPQHRNIQQANNIYENQPRNTQQVNGVQENQQRNSQQANGIHENTFPNIPSSPNGGSYSEKIRAVLYPNQRNWSTGGNFTQPGDQQKSQARQPASTQLPFPNPSVGNGVATASNDAEATILQRLANGQVESPNESGLAQLSRMIQGNNQAPAQIPTTENPQAVLRAAPIQGLPNVETRRIDRHEQAPEPAAPPLSSLSPSSRPLTDPRLPIVPPPTPEIDDVPTMPFKKESTHIDSEEHGFAANGKPQYNTRGFKAVQNSPVKEEIAPVTQAEKTVVAEASPDSGPLPVLPKAPVLDNNAAANNAILMDILQSLPPMPEAPPPPKPEPQVLNGRATRTLGSVLLAGHLVPGDRLDVAQQIQRMLSGVDLNYQLGEILLMFKLLTPDQLLAASLVSYGLINTTQISALGRIRQDLHAIGLEYDLENLIIMFRILTPEQMREVKSSWQG